MDQKDIEHLEHAAELYRAGEKMREWFVDHWQSIVTFLEIAQKVNDSGLDEKAYIAAMEEAVLTLKVVDPQPRLVEFDKQLNIWRGATMKATAAPTQARVDDPGQLLGSIVLLNARITCELAKVAFLNDKHVAESKMWRELPDMLANLEELVEEGAPWQD